MLVVEKTGFARHTDVEKAFRPTSVAAQHQSLTTCKANLQICARRAVVRRGKGDKPARLTSFHRS